MKTTKNIFKYMLAGSMLLTAVSSCKKLEDFGDTNVDPNNSTVAETSSFIASVEGRLGSRTFGTADAAAETLAGFFAQYFAEPTYPGSSRYTDPQTDYYTFYSGPLYDCKIVIDRNADPATAPAAASSGSNANQIAMARILKAYIFWTITDRWGDIPYSEALQGLANPTPAYDTQESIYKDLLKELSEAVDQFDQTGAYVRGDIIYGYTPVGMGGNGTASAATAPTQIGRWQRFANSLRMLVALRTSKVYPNAGDYAATQFAAAYNHPAGYLTSNAENFQLSYAGNKVEYNNPFFGTGNSADLAESQTMTDALAGFGDTRNTVFGSNTTGVPYGLGVAAPTSTTYAKILSTPWKQTNSTMVFIGASYVLLAKAEGLVRGWVTGVAGDDKAAYDAGVTASFAQWNLPVPATYLTTGLANYTSGAGVASIGGSSVAGSNALTPTPLSRIQTQQWFAFYPNGIQGWANWRRTEYLAGGVYRHFPDLKPTVFPATSHTAIPSRYTYGTMDYSLNEAEVTAAAARIGGDDQDTRMWWDPKP